MNEWELRMMLLLLLGHVANGAWWRAIFFTLATCCGLILVLNEYVFKKRAAK